MSEKVVALFPGEQPSAEALEPEGAEPPPWTKLRAETHKLLSTPGPIYITISPAAPGVTGLPEGVPTSSRGLTKLRLSYRFEHPVELTDKGIDATLSIHGKTCDIHVPWEAVLASHKGHHVYFVPIWI